MSAFAVARAIGGGRRRGRAAWSRAINRRLGWPLCVLGWAAATALFFVMIHVSGGVATGDGTQVLIPMYALVHGDFACSYPPIAGAPSFTAPLLPILATPFAAIAHVSTPFSFPASAALGAHCANANSAISTWLILSGAFLTAKGLAYVAWFPFLAGLVALVRATPRGRTLLEPLAACTLAVLPVISGTVTEFFHPEGYLCLGLVMAGLAAVRRGAWGWAGAWLALAVISQQFGLLVIVVVAFAANWRQLVRALVAGVAVLAVVLTPLAVLTDGRVLQSLGGVGDTQYTDTYWATWLHIQSPHVLELLSRGLPIGLAALICLGVRRRFGAAAIAGPALCYLVAVAFVLRVLFEINVWEYYFMAAATLLVVADAIAGRLRLLVIVWAAALWLWYLPIFAPPLAQTNSWPVWIPQVAFSVSALALTALPAWRAARGVGARIGEPVAAMNAGSPAVATPT